MAIIKRINGIQIHRITTNRFWKGKELVVESKYQCKLISDDNVLFETESLDDAVEFCKTKPRMLRNFNIK
ncbi:MAG: hypothetical protein K8F60_16655 [Melioribacteraceae bacterium]|nr:hypothetical protein [Ignavibacteriota bacterium]MBZ0184090.1 hypothetical protein [Melioribacteraceae bacterium]